MYNFKVRLWDKENKKMLYPDDINPNKLNEGIFDTNSAIIGLWLAGEISDSYDEFQEQYLGMQGFTCGLLNSMYEHDFIKLKSFPIKFFDEKKDTKWKEWIFEVIWNSNYTAFIGVNIYDDSHDIIIGQYDLEVIGNRFENPDILPKKDREAHERWSNGEA